MVHCSFKYYNHLTNQSMKKIFEQERAVLFFLCELYPDLQVINLDKESVGFYKRTIKDNPQGFIAIRPPFLFEGETRYNDFSVFLPSGQSYSIECKVRAKSNLSAIHAAICRTKNVLEQSIVFLFQGDGFNINKYRISTFLHNKAKVIYSVNDLALV